MIYLLDTNVIESLRPPADQRVTAWLDQMPPDELRVSVITIGEYRQAAHLLRSRGDQGQAAEYDRLADDTLRLFADRIVGVDVTIAETWAELTPARLRHTSIELIAATAQANGWTLVTRKPKYFERLGVRLLLDPFSE